MNRLQFETMPEVDTSVDGWCAPHAITTITQLFENSGIAKCFDKDAEPMSREDTKKRRLEAVSMWLKIGPLPEVRCAACREHDWYNCTCRR